MKTKKTLEFELNDDYGEKIIFRFLPQESHCHSFDENPPTSWREVYKVYYSWRIISKDEWEEEELFYMGWDECSILTDLGDCIRGVIKSNTKIDSVSGFGMPTSEWSIDPRFYGDEEHVYFTIWKYPTNMGYRFNLTRQRAEEFAEFIDEINQYMLEHGEPI